MTATTVRTTVPASGPAPGSALPSTSARLHLLAVSVALTVLAFVQAPGRIAPDTKADLSIDPIGFMLRAGHLWEPLGDSGQLQNQAYGYFLPMGPFYALGHLLGLPAWIVQRAWWALVLLTAFHGMYRLARRFGVGTHPVQIIAALGFALSPRMITEVGAVSIEVWPMALAPWVLLPLVTVRPGGEVTAAARSGLAVALCGGVNAVAVGAVLPLPAWWLLTREPSPARRSLARWWSLAVVLATFWWLAPLLLLGRYSPPFLDWVESAAVSTSKGTLPGAFRGTTQWVAWFALPQPIWPAGWSVLSSRGGILLGWALITIALLGMLRRDLPHRRFLLGASLGGLLLLTLGHTGPLTAPWAPLVQNFLDAAGAPLRNTHKFDLVLRVPMSLALAHALTRVTIPRFSLPGLPGLPGSHRLIEVVAVCALVGSAAPALVGQLPARGSFTAVPDYWRQAATWLQANDDGARTLIVPGSSFATSIWGNPRDEPFQALARTKWATRSGVPLSSAGNIRMLNVIEQQLETGRGSTGLAEFLTRAGISRVLLRSDLARAFQPGSPPLPLVARSALQASPGLRPVARFGRDLSGSRTAVAVADDGLDVPLAPIEIWQVDGTPRIADVLPASRTVRVAGGPEALLSLAESGDLGDRPAVLAGGPLTGPLPRAPLVATDTLQRREANVAQVRDNYSLVMTADQPWTARRRVHDWLPFAVPASGQTVARYQGIAGVSSSSDAATASAGWYAVDRDPSTAWTSGVFAVDQWVQVRLPAARSFTRPARLTIGPTGARVTRVEVITDRGAARTALNPARTGSPQPVAIPAGPTRTVRVRIAGAVPGDELRPASISDLQLPGVRPARPLVLPDPGPGSGRPDPEPAVISLRSARDGVDGCMFSAGRAICSPRLRQQSQDADLDRELDLPRAAGYAVAGTARLRPGPTADGLLAPDRGATAAMTATASSRRSAEPAERPQAAVDRDPGTAWVAGPIDPAPRLTVRWPGRRPVSRVRWLVDPALAVSRPARLEVRINGRSRLLNPDGQGWVRFPAVRARSITLVVRGVSGLQSVDRVSGLPSVLPVGASEIVVAGSADRTRVALPFSRRVRLGCGSGPPLVVNGTVLSTRLSGSADDVLRRAPMPVAPCGATPPLRAGPNRVTLRSTATVLPESLTLTRGDAASRLPSAEVAVPPLVREADPEHRTVEVNRESYPQVLVVHENFNRGWRAELGDATLRPVRLDGWQQGYLVPAGSAGRVRLTFTPGPVYRGALTVGLLLVAGLAAMACPWRRAGWARSARAARAARSASGRRSRHAAWVPLAEAGGRRSDTVLGIGALVFVTGAWGTGVLAALLVAVARRWPLRSVVATAGALAGIGAAIAVREDTEAAPGSLLSILAATVLLACLVLRLDDAGAGETARITGWMAGRSTGWTRARISGGLPAAAHGASGSRTPGTASGRTTGPAAHPGPPVAAPAGPTPSPEARPAPAPMLGRLLGRLLEMIRVRAEEQARAPREGPARAQEPGRAEAPAPTEAPVPAEEPGPARAPEPRSPGPD